MDAITDNLDLFWRGILKTLEICVWAGILALVAGLGLGVIILKVGIDRGGRLLERRWPEALQAVSERVG